MNEYPSYARQRVAMRLSLTFEPLQIRFEGGGIGPHVGPSTHDGDALAYRCTRRTHGVVRRVELPSAVVPYTNGGAAAPVLCRIGLQEIPFAARPHKREHIGGRHRRVMRIEDGHGDPLRRPRVGNTVAPRLVELRDGQALLKGSRRAGIASHYMK